VAHAFDSQQSAPQRTRMQHAAISLLSGLKRSAGGYLMNVIPFAFQLRPNTDKDDVAQFVSAISKAPSIAVAIGDRTSEIKTIGGFMEWGEVELLVYFSSNHARDQQIGRQEIDAAGLASDTADPGLHVALEHARELLLGQYCAAAGTDIKQIRPHREEEIVTLQPISIWLQTYRVSVMFQISEFRTVTQLLESIRFRAAQNPNEAHLPAAATDVRTIDVHEDSLA
jgi:hypothetical protein